MFSWIGTLFARLGRLPAVSQKIHTIKYILDRNKIHSNIVIEAKAIGPWRYQKGAVMATTTTNSKVTRKQVYTVLCGNPDTLAPLFEGAGISASQAMTILQKALKTVSTVAAPKGETAEAKANKATAYKFAGTLDPDALFVPRDILSAFPILRSSQKATSVARAGVTAGYFESHVLTCAVGDFKKSTRVYRLLTEIGRAWPDATETVK